MISTDAVVVLPNGFVTVERLNPNQRINCFGEYYSWLKKIDYSLRRGILINTKHFDIVCDGNQRFISDTGEVIKAKDLTLCDHIRTINGLDFIVKLESIDEFIEMANLTTNSSLYIANGFILMSE